MDVPGIFPPVSKNAFIEGYRVLQSVISFAGCFVLGVGRIVSYNTNWPQTQRAVLHYRSSYLCLLPKFWDYIRALPHSARRYFVVV